jgi:hypothetical protein
MLPLTLAANATPPLIVEAPIKDGHLVRRAMKPT